MKIAAGVGNARGAGAAESFRWQKSVGRVVRFEHRYVERRDGEVGALARRKLEDPLTRITGGEKANRHAVARFLNQTRDIGSRASAREILDTTEGVLGPPVVWPLPAFRRGVL